MAPERLGPQAASGSLLDRLGRYAFAARFVAGKRVLDLAPGTGTALLERAGAAEVAIEAANGPFDVVLALDESEPLPPGPCRELLREDGLLLIALPADAAARAAVEQALDAVFDGRVTMPVQFVVAAVAAAEEMPAVDAGRQDADCHVALCSPTYVRLHPGGSVLALRHLVGPVEEEARAWRSVADDRDRALEEVERVNSFLDRQNGERAQEIDRLQADRRDLEQRLRQALTLSFGGRVARKLRALFPRETLPGRALHSGLQLARRFLKRSA